MRDRVCGGGEVDLRRFRGLRRNSGFSFARAERRGEGCQVGGKVGIRSRDHGREKEMLTLPGDFLPGDFLPGDFLAFLDFFPRDVLPFMAGSSSSSSSASSSSASSSSSPADSSSSPLESLLDPEEDEELELEGSS